MVLANTEELHEKIEHLRSRVRELEDGLRALHSQQCLISHILSLETICRVSKHPQPVPVPPDQIILHLKLNHLSMRGATEPEMTIASLMHLVWFIVYV
jgi:hypothetical protein